MPRQKVKSDIRNTDQASKVLYQIGKLQISIERITGEYELEINKLKARLEKETRPLVDQAESLKQQLKLFAFDLYEIESYKTKELIFGKITIHKGKPTIALAEGVTEAEAIEHLQGSKYSECVKTKPSLDKAAIKKSIPEDSLHRYGLQLIQKEEFAFDLFREKIDATESIDLNTLNKKSA